MNHFCIVFNEEVKFIHYLIVKNKVNETSMHDGNVASVSYIVQVKNLNTREQHFLYYAAFFC